MSSDLNKKLSSEADVGILANNLRRLMHELNTDASEISKKTGIALTTINGLKRGIGNPTLSTLHELADFFNVTIGQLTETNMSVDNKKSRFVYEIPLLVLDELTIFLKDRKKYWDILCQNGKWQLPP